MNLTSTQKANIRTLCEQHHVRRLFVFGSVLKESFANESDIDFVVDFNEFDLMGYADNYFDFKDALESLFNRPVDLLEEKAIRNPFLKEQIDTEKRLLWNRQ